MRRGVVIFPFLDSFCSRRRSRQPTSIRPDALRLRSRSTGDDDDVVKGLGGNDVCGGSGEDVLRGNGGNDTLRGEGSADTLIGGVGTDTLIGGPGSDVERQ